MESKKNNFKRKVAWCQIILIIFIVMFSLTSVTSVLAQEHDEVVEKVNYVERANVISIGLISAAVAFGFGALGAGIAIANIGSAAMGAIGEKPEIAGQALLFIALADGLVVFGFITALMILGKV